MPSTRAVVFINGSPFYLSGYRNSDTHIRGMVENGAYSLYIVKQGKNCWIAYSATSKNQCYGSNQLGTPFTEADVCIVDVPEKIVGDYNSVIEWARRQLSGAA